MSMILTLNAGSSSLKFSLFETGDLTQTVLGQVDRIAQDTSAVLKIDGGSKAIGPCDHAGAVTAILDQIGDQEIMAVGHRVVHGGTRFEKPEIITLEVLEEIEALSPLAPLHQPHNIAAIRAAQARFPSALQLACFDTAFHRTHPFVADAFALPRNYYDAGIRRYGFHGLSYSYIAAHLAKEEPELAKGRVIVAHLGNGASMCAMLDGKSIASTMGFTALDGLAMGTRSGQIDPGVLLHLLGEGLNASDLTTLLYKQSGLLGLSGISGDMRDLLASSDPHARQAIDYYAYRLRHEIGALSAALGGLDGLVFCGGIGENAAPIRAAAVENMGWLGLGIDQVANGANAREIGTGNTRTLVIPTNEEHVIAQSVLDHL